MWASINDHVAMVELLLTHGADSNAADAKGKTALMWESRKGHYFIPAKRNSF
jgi:ankyrin repeat protein